MECDPLSGCECILYIPDIKSKSDYIDYDGKLKKITLLQGQQAKKSRLAVGDWINVIYNDQSLGFFQTGEKLLGGGLIDLDDEFNYIPALVSLGCDCEYNGGVSFEVCGLFFNCVVCAVFVMLSVDVVLCIRLCFAILYDRLHVNEKVASKAPN